MRTLEDLMADAPLFAGLPARQLTLVAGCGRTERAPAGGHLFRAGAEAERFYLIREGALALEVDVPGRGPVVIETLHAGDVAGWSWLFEPHRWQFDGRVTEPLALVGFDGRCLLGKCETDHELGYELMRRFAATTIDRLQATRLQLLDVYANPGAR
jgi:CRP-like cAMP-binding protein